MTNGGSRNGEYDEFLDAIDAGRGYYETCSNGHGVLPPRRVCPHCGDQELQRKPLPETGTIVTYTTISVATPRFADDVPYVTAIATFGPVRLTGILNDVDRIEIGGAVTVHVEPAETDGERMIAFRPVS